jgi:hypothetical protein
MKRILNGPDIRHIWKSDTGYLMQAQYQAQAGYTGTLQPDTGLPAECYS